MRCDRSTRRAAVQPYALTQAQAEHASKIPETSNVRLNFRTQQPPHAPAVEDGAAVQVPRSLNRRHDRQQPEDAVSHVGAVKEALARTWQGRCFLFGSRGCSF